MDALGDGYHAIALLFINAVHIGQELVHVEVRFGEVYQVGARAVSGGQGSGASQPASVTAHNLDDADHSGIIDPGVLVDLHAAGGDILGGGGEAGAVVGSKEVVVDGFGHAHNPALVAHFLHVFADFVAGVHGVVSAVVEEIADVVLFENLQDALIVRIVHVRVLHLITAGAQGGGRSVFQQLQLGGVLLAHVEQTVVQHTFDAVLRAQDAGDTGVFQSGADDAVGAGVDDRSGPAGLAEDTGAFQFTHEKQPPQNIFSSCLSPGNKAHGIFYHTIQKKNCKYLHFIFFVILS